LAGLQITEAQRAFLESRFRGTVFVGGIGSGKTLILCRKGLHKVLEGRRMAIVSFSYPTLRDVVLRTLEEEIELHGLLDDMEISKSEMTVRSGRGELLLRSGDRPDSLRGLNLTDFAIDEAREFRTREVYDVLLGRIRSASDAQWYITTTPRGKDWVWSLTQQVGVEQIRQKTQDNPFLPPEYIAELRQAYSRQFAAQELDAEFVEFGAGLIKPEWLPVSDVRLVGRSCRSWDFAVSEKKHADASAGALLTFGQDGKAQIADMITVRESWPALRRRIVETALRDGPPVPLVLEESGQQLALIEDLRAQEELRPFQIQARKPHGDKVARAMPWISAAEGCKLTLLRGNWNNNFQQEAISFSGDDSHQHDDQLDAVSQAWAFLCKPKISAAPNLLQRSMART
jgi:predicted phage terminase large subunit-like protein